MAKAQSQDEAGELPQGHVKDLQPLNGFFPAM